MSTADLTDEGLGRRALAGDRDAFAELFARHERGLFTIAHRLTGSAEDAADITQEAFLRVFARLDALEGRDVNLPAYLYRTARNLVYDRSARRARELPVEDMTVVAGPDTAAGSDPALSALIGAQGADVRAANARLPERHRLALALREIEDMSYEDIGAVLDTTPGAVAALLVRARLGLRRELRLGQVDTAAMDPGCRTRLGDVGALIDGELDADRAHVLSQHLELCPSCRAARHDFEQARVLYRAWLPLPLVLGLGAATAKAAESRGLVRFADVGRRAGAARAARGLRAGALVAAGSIGALVLFGAPTIVAIRSDSGPPSPLVAPAAAAPATTTAGRATTATPATTPPGATIAAPVAAPGAGAAAVPVAAPAATAPGDPADPPAIGPVVKPRRARTSAPPAVTTTPPVTTPPPAGTVAAPPAAPGTTQAPGPDPPPAGGTTTADPPPATTQPPPATVQPPPGGTIPTVPTDGPPGGVF